MFSYMLISAVIIFFNGIRDQEEPLLHDLLGHCQYSEVYMNTISNDACTGFIGVEDRTRETGITVMQRRHGIEEMGGCIDALYEPVSGLPESSIAVACGNCHPVIPEYADYLRCAYFRSCLL